MGVAAFLGGRVSLMIFRLLSRGFQAMDSTRQDALDFWVGRRVYVDRAVALLHSD